MEYSKEGISKFAELIIISKLFQTIVNAYDNYNNVNIIFLINFDYWTNTSSYIGDIAHNSHFWFIPLFSDEYDDMPSTLIPNDHCKIDINIKSKDFVFNKSDDSDVNKEYDLAYGQYYLYSTIPLSQFIKDGSRSKYLSSNKLSKSSIVGVYYSKFSTKNTIENDEIDSFTIVVDESLNGNGGGRFDFEFNDSIVDYGLLWAEYNVEYLPTIEFAANINGFDYKYVTKKL